jgi:diguanylate cyclase (GGDEF)-like protein/PAS domain S-box-containing protein
MEPEVRNDTNDLLRRLAFAEALTRATPDCLYIFDMTTNEFRYQNTTVQEFLGYTTEQLAEIEFDFYVQVGHPDEFELTIEAQLAQRQLREGEFTERTYRLRTGTGEYRWFSLRNVAFSSNADGSPREVLGLLRDVHEATIASQRLTESEQRFRELFDRSPSGIALVNDEGRFTEVNDAFCEFLGMLRDDLMSTSYDAVVHPDERQAARNARLQFRLQGTRTLRNERRFVAADGTVRWARTSVTRVIDEGRPISLVAFEDMTATKKIEEQLRHAAMHDSLTGLPNRRMLIDALDHALSRRRRNGRPLAVMFVDLDRVKQVNDQLGHEAGDDLLVTVSRRLETAMRGTDTVARVGGDEFVIICPDLETELEVPVLAQRVLEALRVEVAEAAGTERGAGATNAVPLTVSASVGVALASSSLDNANALIAAADRAMYQAKHTGRDRFHIAAGPVVVDHRPTVPYAL